MGGRVGSERLSNNRGSVLHSPMEMVPGNSHGVASTAVTKR